MSPNKHCFFPRLCFFPCLAPWPRPLPPGLSTLINGSWLGTAQPQGNDKYPSRMDSQSSNSYLKGRYHPEEIHQLYFIAIFSTLYFISIPLFRKCFKYTTSHPSSLSLHCSIGILRAFSLDLHHSLGPKSQFAGPDIQITTDAPKESECNKPFLSIKGSKRRKRNC